uniref:Uncharacterized protein n=1 Tax=Plectus sambesii TaxID=2011161 RepID=A0A914WD10_9BILA
MAPLLRGDLNTGIPAPPILHADPVQGPVQPITTAEVEEALRRMKNGKPTGPDDIATELWKSRSWNPATWLTMFFNKIVTEKKAPTNWSCSIMVPIWKKKGSPANPTPQSYDEDL